MPKAILFHFKKPEESSGFLLWQVSMAWQRKIKHALDTLDITNTQFVLLAALGWLSKEQVIVTQIDIAHHSQLDRMMVSKVLQTLQKKGMIVRQKHKIDSRAKSISLTSAGQSTLQKSLKQVEKVDKDFFSPLQKHEKLFNQNMQQLVKKNQMEV